MTRYGFSVGLTVAVILSSFVVVQTAKALDEATCKKLVDCSPAGLTKAKLTADACKAKMTACLAKKGDDTGDRRVDPAVERGATDRPPPAVTDKKK